LSDAPPSSRRILLVEDDPHNADIARIVLRNAGWDVTWVARGDEAAAVAAEGPWAAIVVDLLLPGQDGRELIARLRSNAAFAAVPILCVSALAATSDQAEALAAGADGYLTKPYRVRDLLDALTAAIQARRGG
jgi:DNA-binding response OmpR family regulator